MYLEFPKTITPQKYYASHARYILESAKAAGLEVKLCDFKDTTRGIPARLNGEFICFDYSDHPALKCAAGAKVVFKFHMSHNIIYPEHVHSFPPISFYDWKQFEQLRQTIKYDPYQTWLVTCRQYERNRAAQQRKEVKAKLAGRFGKYFQWGILDQESFWQDVSCSSVAVCVPNVREDILDRGQWQYMALGCCTVSPVLDVRLPWDVMMPGIHYAECKLDFSNVVEVVERLLRNPSETKRIGDNAAELFKNVGQPNSLWKWVGKWIGD